MCMPSGPRRPAGIWGRLAPHGISHSRWLCCHRCPGRKAVPDAKKRAKGITRWHRRCWFFPIRAPKRGHKQSGLGLGLSSVKPFAQDRATKEQLLKDQGPAPVEPLLWIEGDSWAGPYPHLNYYTTAGTCEGGLKRMSTLLVPNTQLASQQDCEARLWRGRAQNSKVLPQAGIQLCWRGSRVWSKGHNSQAALGPALWEGLASQSTE